MERNTPKPARKNILKKKGKKEGKPRTRRQKVFRRLLILFWLVVLGPYLAISLMLVLAGSGAFGELPSFDELENPKSNLASEIYSADHKVLGKYFKENRTNARYDELSPYLLKALIATEDERFNEHSGIDLWATLRAAVYFGKKGGASTITQQLAKMLFHKKPSGFIARLKQKAKEWIIACKLEKSYTKEEIVTMYLNRFDFINNAVGIKSASHVYFSVAPIDLKIEQAAMLVGMAKNPSLFNPIRVPEDAKARRNVVLGQMVRNKYITQAECDSLQELPLGLRYSKVDHNEGLAPYFREYLREELDELLQEKDDDGEFKYTKKDGGTYDVYRDGLRIYTTIDSRMQEYAEYAVTEHLSTDLQPTFNEKLKNKRNAPFSYKVSETQIDQIMEAAKIRSHRYQVLVGKECAVCGRRGKYLDIGTDSIRCNADDCGHRIKFRTAEEIEEVFDTPVEMEVFSWEAGEEEEWTKKMTMSPRDSIRYYKGFFQAGVMSMDPHTGFVKAWVGGINHHHFKFDHVKKAKRQVGSTFKPFVYAAYVQDGHSPCEQMENVPVRFDKDKWGLPKDWQAKNSGGGYGDMVTLKFGLGNSLNTVSARIMHSFDLGGPKAIIDMARKMGVKSDLPEVPSLCLGVADLSVYEMVGANATFANHGIYTEPIVVTRIEDKHGNLIFEVEPNTVQAMKPETAYTMLVLMKGVCDGVYNPATGKRSSTGGRIRSRSRPYGGIKTPIAGKTGTTQNNSDGWFIGITPDLVTGVWVGAEDRSVHFDQTLYGQGANMALPIWGYYMNKVYDDKTIKISKGDFEKPDIEWKIELDCETYDAMNAPFEEIDYGDEDEDY